VVALINTLHRFSESLEAVNDFRQMWAKISTADSAKLILEAEGKADGRVHIRFLHLVSSLLSLTSTLNSHDRRLLQAEIDRKTC
jgi:hypothetical protein